MTPDNELLRRYASTGSEDAFAELVSRYVNLVYSAALRQVGGNAHLAQDTAQTVFTDLARKADSLSNRESLAGWLYTSAHFAASNIVRREARRRGHEENFMRSPIHDPAPQEDWERLRPALDSVMHELKEADREALLLRYFENRPFAEVGLKLGVNENTARMRVERALEKLRTLLAKRGVTAGAALASVISANAVQVAPGGLAAVLTSTSLATASAGTSLTLLKLMTATKLKLLVGTLAVAGAATTLVIQHRAEKTLSNENELLREQVSQLNSNVNFFSNKLSDAEIKSSPVEQAGDLLKLRAQVADLRHQMGEAAKIIAQNVHQTGSSDTTNDPAAAETQRSMRGMRAAKDIAAAAVWGYAEHHQAQFPTNWNQVKSYFDEYERNGLNPGEVMPDTAADFNWVTNEYEFVYQGSTKDLTDSTNFNDTIVVREKQAWQRPSDGKWIKTYGFADGHGQLMAEPPEGFAVWESQHMAQPPTN